MHETTRTWLLASVALLLSLLVIISFAGYRTIRNLQSSTLSLRHSRELLEALERLVSTVKDAESGQRGYLLTGKDAYLEPFHAVRVQNSDDLARIEDLTADNSIQHARTPRLRELMSAKLDELTKIVAMQSEGNSDAALQFVRTGDGKRRMEQIQSLVNQMDEDERESMSNRKWANADVYRAASFSVVCIGLLALVALVVFVHSWCRRLHFWPDRQPPSSNNENRPGQPASAT